ncbi:hypothetical protein [Flavobacterium sp.]|uniref:hypothetical protein n=1 Tax=Flavobacterium sp. TaxID=239 RepID=UPI0037C0E671
MMRTNFQKSLLLYTFFVIIGIVGMVISKKGKIINSIDIIIQEVGWVIGLIALFISIFLLHKIFVFKSITDLPNWVKPIVHFFSITFISMFLVGSLIIINNCKKEKILLSVKIIDAYERLPKQDYKYSFSYSRYYIKFIDLATKSTYHAQVTEQLYDDALLQKIEVENATDLSKGLNKETVAFMKKYNIKLPKQKKYVVLKISKGLLGFWI